MSDPTGSWLEHLRRIARKSSDSKNAVCSLKTLEVSYNTQFSLFFIDGDLFTVTDHDLSNGNECSFAKELIFPDDQIVMFPSNMGFSGDVH